MAPSLKKDDDTAAAAEAAENDAWGALFEEKVGSTQLGAVGQEISVSSPLSDGDIKAGANVLFFRSSLYIKCTPFLILSKTLFFCNMMRLSSVHPSFSLSPKLISF